MSVLTIFPVLIFVVTLLRLTLSSELRQFCEDLVYIYQHLDHIRSAITNIKEKILLEARKGHGIIRAHD